MRLNSNLDLVTREIIENTHLTGIIRVKNRGNGKAANILKEN